MRSDSNWTGWFEWLNGITVVLSKGGDSVETTTRCRLYWALTAIDLKAFRIFSMVCYLGLGWAAVFVWGPMAKAYAAVVMRLLLAGGVAYTVGAVCYIIGKRKSVRYVHGVFHIFCLIGSVLHFISILSLG